MRDPLILLPTAMKTPLFYALLLAACIVTPAGAWPGGGTLNLVSDASYNKLQVTVGIPSYSASNTQTTTVTGTVDVLADVDPATGATTALTLTGGNVAMSNMRFVIKVFLFFTAADVTTAGMAGTVYTPPPLPAPATPTATGGTFDAALHHLVINSGTLSGTAGYPTASPVNVNFAESPIDGAGTGTGTITVVPGASGATHRTCQTTIVLPVDFTNTQDLNGTAVSVRVKGNVKAVGNILIPLNSAVAGTSTWINPAGGTWATPANWLAAVIGNGTAADFSTLNLTSDATATLDGARTVRGLVFGDTTPSHKWTLAPGTGGSLTLDDGATQPGIAVTNSTATLGVVLEGTQGFAKTGSGTLILTQANTCTGATTVSGGTLNVGGGGATGSLPGTPITVAAGATLAYHFSTPFTAPALSVTGNLAHTSAAQLGLAGTYGANQLTAAGANVSVNGDLTLNAGPGNATVTGSSATAAGITSGGPRRLTSTGTVTLTGTTGSGQFIDGISLAGAYTANTGTLTFDGTAATGGAYGMECGVFGVWTGAISTFGTVVFKGTGGGGGSGGHDGDLNLGNLSGNGTVTLLGRNRGLRTNGTFTATGGLPYNVIIQTTAGSINGLLNSGTDTTGNGNFTVNSAGGVTLGNRVINAGTGTISLTSATGYAVTGNATLQSAALTMGDTRDIAITAGKTLTLKTTGTLTNNISGAALAITGGAVTLAGSNNTYTGNTLVNGGTLALASGGSLTFKIGANGVNTQLTGTGTANLDGTFKLDLTTAAATPGNAWTLVNVATLTETFGPAFAVDGFAENANVWTMIRDNKKWTFTEADGKLTVVGTYGSWATDRGIPGEPATMDHDHDGLDNGLEYALGLDPVVANGSPGTVTVGVLSFIKGAAAIANGDVTYVIETSDDLGTWTPRVTQAPPNPSPTISYALPTGSPKEFARLKITIQ